jgi:hypothetical protein
VSKIIDFRKTKLILTEMLYKEIASALILVCYLFNIKASKELFSL